MIVPLDGSAASEHVLPIAVQVARGSDATLRPLSMPKSEAVRTLENGTAVDVALSASSSQHPQAYLEQIRQRLAAGSNLTITTDVLQGPNGHANAARPDVTDMDLVVLASHCHDGMVSFRLANITDALVFWQPAPLLALPSASTTLATQPEPRFRRMLLRSMVLLWRNRSWCRRSRSGRPWEPSTHCCTSLIPTAW